MAEPLKGSRPVAQEIFLLERYTSTAYFSGMRDDWERMVQHAEDCLAAFTTTLPPDYRSRPLPDQPDIVWGKRVLPNFRDTRDALNRACISLTHGDLQALGHAGRVTSDFAGFSRDYSSDWMDEPQIAGQVEGGGARFWHWLTQAVEKATNIETTLRAHWVEGDLTSRYDEARGPLDPPPEWPRYSLDPSLRTATGQPAPVTGVYLPQIADSCAAFIVQDAPAPPASVGYDPDTFQNRSEAACGWQLIVRAASE